MPAPNLQSRQQHPALAAAREAVLLDYLRLRALRPENQTPEAREAKRIEKAWCLAPSPEIKDALLRGERVPVELLDQVWVRRYGLRHRNGNGTGSHS